MRAVRVLHKQAEAMKKRLLESDLIDHKFKPDKDEKYLYFPLVAEPDFPVEIVEHDFHLKTKEVLTLREALQGSLTELELDDLKTAYDIVGDIAIIEIPDSLIEKEKVIGESLLEINKNIKTVLKKVGGHEGEFRTQKMGLLAGKDTRETIVKENSVRLKLNVESVYYSVRSATERMRIAKQVKTGERILVMFSGCAPYPCVLSKNTEASKIVGVEKNPEGHKYGEENLKLNKLKNVELFLGDVRDVVSGLGEFDRIIMPLPKHADDFLDVALLVSSSGCVVHMYVFSEESEDVEIPLIEKCSKLGKQIKILDVVTCGQQSPHVYRTCIDFVIQ